MDIEESALFEDEKDSLNYDKDEKFITSIGNTLEGGDWYKKNPVKLLKNIDTTTDSSIIETGKDVLDWINPKSSSNKDNWRKTKEDVRETAKNKNADNLAWLKAAGENSVKVDGSVPPSAAMQKRINDRKTQAGKDWQTGEIDRYAKEKQYLQMKSSGTSMGSGKLPIGNNIRKSGSQIGKHMK